jgi:curved DNA-binding protein CbpA
VSDDEQEQSHYDVLGVDPNASKDEIREAYRDRLAEAQAEVTDAETAKRPEGSRIAAARAEEASVRSAWQVLSDPVQRERHDSSIGVTRDDPADQIREDGDDDLDEEVDDEADDRTPARRTAADRRRPQQGERPPGLFSTDHPPTPPSWPPGFRPPPPRARLIALGIDVVVLAVIMIAQQFLGVLVVEQIYPEQTKKLDQISDCIDALEAVQEADRGTARQARRVERSNDECATVAVVTPFDEGAEPRDSQVDNRIEKAEERQDDLQSEILPAQFGVLLVAVALALIYLIPSSVRSGRTLGKHLMRIHVVMDDGSKLRFGAALSRYGTPVLAAFLFASILGPLAFALILFGVLTWPRNANLQGLHDRLAHTIVVDG